jgi:hypothetical protein
MALVELPRRAIAGRDEATQFPVPRTDSRPAGLLARAGRRPNPAICYRMGSPDDTSQTVVSS